MILNEDYRDILQCFVDEGVEFLLVGAYAMAAHGYVRATLDMDLWIMPSAANAEAVLKALRQFGAPVARVSARDLQTENIIFQIGVAPRRIDILTSADALRFGEAFKNAIVQDIDGITVPVLSISDLIRNKRATGRTKDLADAEALEVARHSEEAE